MGGVHIMARIFKDWLHAYTEYASFSEAPRRMHFWSGVSAISGALRRRVWIDMSYFKWHVNQYIIFVAPPGIVSKSTTVAIAMDLLRKVPGVQFGPDVVTWPALVTAFAAATEQFQLGEEWYTQSALTLVSSEFGNLVNPQDREMVDMMVNLWDSHTGAFKKVTKGSGNDTVENPFINLIACTTPAWIAGNFPEYVIGGGFTSRCLFVYAETKDKFVAYPSQSVPKNLADAQAALVRILNTSQKRFVALISSRQKPLSGVKLGTVATMKAPPRCFGTTIVSGATSPGSKHTYTNLLWSSPRRYVTIYISKQRISNSQMR